MRHRIILTNRVQRLPLGEPETDFASQLLGVIAWAPACHTDQSSLPRHDQPERLLPAIKLEHRHAYHLREMSLLRRNSLSLLDTLDFTLARAVQKRLQFLIAAIAQAFDFLSLV